MLLLMGFLILGMVAGLLAGLLGIGGGIIIIPGLIYLFETTQFIVPQELMRVALGTSLASVVFTTAITLMIHARHNNIRWPLAKQLIPGLLLGAIIGSYLASIIDTHLLAILFASFLLLLSLRFIFNWHGGQMTTFLPTPIMWLVGIVIGSCTSMLGLGGGVLLIPLLSHLPLSMREVSALSIVCILPVAILATLGYIIFGYHQVDLPNFSTGYVYWPAVLPIIIMSSIFAPIGIAWAKRLPSEKLKRIFGVLLLCISISLLITE